MGTDADGDAPGAGDVRVTGCERCSALCESRSQIVNGVGPTDAPLVFVGEAPGEREDTEGEPFVGRSGEVLDDALRGAGLARADVRITNCVRCRPPDNRDPTAGELDNCRDHLARELAAVDPELIVTLGKVPSSHLLDRSVSVTTAAGETFDTRIGGRSYRLLVCLHPAATLYDRSQAETFEATIDRAAALVGAGAGGDGGQSRLDEF